MSIETMFNDARSVFTVISFVTFVGIMLWTCSARRKGDFEAAANLPFVDDDLPLTQVTEKHNG